MSFINVKNKISKKNKLYNNKSKKIKNIFNSIKKKKNSKRIININSKKKGGKPLVGENIYTYFIIAHGIMTTYLKPIPVPINSSIITITDAGISTNVQIANEIIKFYMNNNRLFNNMDRSKHRTENGELFISQTLPKYEINEITGIINKTNIRNHVQNSEVNDISISFYPNKTNENEEYLGIIRYNHKTRVTDHYDIKMLRNIENINKDFYGILTLNSLLHYIFNTPNFNEQIVFDNHVTIIPIVCRIFMERLLKDEEEVGLIRSISSAADEVPSSHDITELDLMSKTRMPYIDTEIVKWFRKGSKVLLKNGNIGIIVKFYELGIPDSIKIDIEINFPQLANGIYVFVKDVIDRTDLNGKLGRIVNNFNLNSKTWSVMIDDETIVLSYNNLQVCDLEINSTVKIVGLKSRTDLNGLKSKIIGKFDNSKKKWPVLVNNQNVLVSINNLEYFKKKNIITIHREEIIDIIIDNIDKEEFVQSTVKSSKPPVIAKSSGIDYSKWDKLDYSD